jgi:hypothetical protein
MKNNPMTLGARAATLALAAVLAVQPAITRAAIVDTEALAHPSQADLDRAKVQDFLDRADVSQRLQAMGVGGLVAADRVAALSEAEVHALAQRIDAMPAGGALSNADLILILLIALIVALAV